MKKIAVLGAGESGAGAAILAKKQGFAVFVSDQGSIKPKYKEQLINANIEWEENTHTISSIYDADEVIKSPGIPDHLPLIKGLREKGIPVISELEFAARFTNAQLVCITGSNGKTTTTLLTWHILKKAGLNVGLAGNVGNSFAWQVAHSDFSHYVLEISSFQLDGMYDFKADIAVLTNITPDHLDRYNNNFREYINSKFRITQNLTKNDAFIYCADDEVILEEIQNRNIQATGYPFSLKNIEPHQGAFISGDQLTIKTNTKPLNMSIHELALQGKHNLYNSMAAGIAARVLEIRKELVRESLSDFQNIEHRLEFVAEIHGISFINDSKATNVNSTWFALESQMKPVIWVVGGVDKGNDYSILLPMVKEKVKAIICLGKDNKKIVDFFGPHIEQIVEAGSAVEAVNYGYRFGKKGDVVLLSPACASFDLFENYEDRGQKFKDAVRAL